MTDPEEPSLLTGFVVALLYAVFCLGLYAFVIYAWPIICIVIPKWF
jgi:hypothetical protein